MSTPSSANTVLLAPLDDDDLERLILAHSPRFQALLDKSRGSIKRGKGLLRDEFWQAVEQRYPPPSSSHRMKNVVHEEHEDR